jgi:hypothetical protein
MTLYLKNSFSSFLFLFALFPPFSSSFQRLADIEEERKRMQARKKERLEKEKSSGGLTTILSTFFIKVSFQYLPKRLLAC